MSTYEVWAPLPKSVAVEVDGVRHPMSKSRDGVWTSDVEVEPGVDYGFVLDDADTALPDPRSRRQPDGVHGLSRTYDPGAFDWTDDSWTGRALAGSMIYELHLGTFTPEGTLDAATGKLDHLVSIGVDFVEVLPVNGFNGTHNWGYDGVLWYTVDESYGGPAAYQRFVDACHARGIGVIQDVVYNHLGPSGNYLPEYAPIFHESGSSTWGASLNLDMPELRRYILDNAAMWMRDYHVDGLRLDAVHALVDTSEKHILKELAEETGALAAFVDRPLSLIAESDLNDPIMFESREAGGYGLTAQWSDDFHHAVHVALTRETTGYYEDFANLEALAKVYTHGFYHDGTYSSFRERNHGRPIDTENTDAWRLVVANQNHDQIGNRAIGDRLTATLDTGRLSIAAVLTLAGPFTPMLFMGEEWGATTPWQFFTSHPEPDLGKATAEGRIKEFEKMGWDPDVVPDPQDPQTFADSKLDWSESESGDHARLLALYAALAELRRTVPELTDPRYPHLRVEFQDRRDERWLVQHRGEVAIVVNFADAPLELSTGALARPLGERILLTTDAAASVSADTVSLPAHSAVILHR